MCIRGAFSVLCSVNLDIRHFYAKYSQRVSEVRITAILARCLGNPLKYCEYMTPSSIPLKVPVCMYTFCRGSM